MNNIHKFIQKAGLKDEKAFYKKYPSEEHFFNDYPDMKPQAAYGSLIPDEEMQLGVTPQNNYAFTSVNPNSEAMMQQVYSRGQQSQPQQGGFKGMNSVGAGLMQAAGQVGSFMGDAINALPGMITALAPEQQGSRVKPLPLSYNPNSYGTGSQAMFEDGGSVAYNPNLSSNSKFKAWFKKNTPEGKSGQSYDSTNGDYDYVSFFMNGDYKNYKGGHFPDTYKKPNHQTFSNESIYSTPENPGGMWQGEEFSNSGAFQYEDGGVIRSTWNKFADWLSGNKYAGSKSLDKGKKSTKLIERYNKENDANISPDFVKNVQRDFIDNNYVPAPSTTDGWVGSITSTYRYPEVTQTQPSPAKKLRYEKLVDANGTQMFSPVFEGNWTKHEVDTAWKNIPESFSGVPVQRGAAWQEGWQGVKAGTTSDQWQPSNNAPQTYAGGVRLATGSGMKNGGKLDAIYTQDKNDPRLKSYSDSLKLFNNGFKSEADIYSQLPDYNVNIDPSTVNNGTNIKPVIARAANPNAKKYIPHYDRNQNIVPNMADLATVYKKPVQPVVYGRMKEQLNSLPLSGENISTLNPQLQNASFNPDVTNQGEAVYAIGGENAPLLGYYSNGQFRTSYENPDAEQYTSDDQYMQNLIKRNYGTEYKKYADGGLLPNNPISTLAVEDNQIQPLSPSFSQLGGETHANGGTDISYNGQTVEAQKGEPVSTNQNGDIIAWGKMKNPLTNRMFESDAKILAKDENEVNKMRDKSEMFMAMSAPTPLKAVKFNTGDVLQSAANIRSNQIEQKKELYSDTQQNLLRLANALGKNPKKVAEKFAKGGKLKAEPIYTEDKNDPRLKAYNDSMSYYRIGQKNLQDFGGNQLTPAQMMSRYDTNKYADGSGNPTTNKPGATVRYNTNTEDGVDFSTIAAYNQRKSSLPMQPSSFVGQNDDYSPVYKKPVQPVILGRKKDNLNSLPLAGNPTTLNPQLQQAPPFSSNQGEAVYAIGGENAPLLGYYQNGQFTNDHTNPDAEQYTSDPKYMQALLQRNYGTKYANGGTMPWMQDEEMMIPNAQPSLAFTPINPNSPEQMQQVYSPVQQSDVITVADDSNNTIYDGDHPNTNNRVRPSLADSNKLGLSSFAGELAAAFDRPDYVQGQYYTPELYSPYTVSFQDQINQNQGDFNQLAQTLRNSPEALSTLAANKYQANSSILANQFRTNQQVANQTYNQNVSTLNDAALKNIQLADQQYTRQAQAQTNTEAGRQAALNSISSKLLQNKAENNKIRLMENFSNYRTDEKGNLVNYNGTPTFNYEGGTSTGSGNFGINRSEYTSQEAYDRAVNRARNTALREQKFTEDQRNKAKKLSTRYFR